jgi:hypothetical protein
VNRNTPPPLPLTLRLVEFVRWYADRHDQAAIDLLTEWDNAQAIRERLAKFGIAAGEITLLPDHDKAGVVSLLIEAHNQHNEAEQRIQCPWCNKGWLEPTPPEYKDPKAVVYCPDCSTVYRLNALPEVSP